MTNGVNLHLLVCRQLGEFLLSLWLVYVLSSSWVCSWFSPVSFDPIGCSPLARQNLISQTVLKFWLPSYFQRMSWSSPPTHPQHIGHPAVPWQFSVLPDSTTLVRSVRIDVLLPPAVGHDHWQVLPGQCCHTRPARNVGLVLFTVNSKIVHYEQGLVICFSNELRGCEQHSYIHCEQHS